MLFLADCLNNDLEPILKLLKNGVIPLIQIGIIAILVVLLIIDFGKAVAAGKEDEIKSAQKLAIKRVVYALVVFLVPWIVNIAIGLLTYTGEKNLEKGTGEQYTGLGCWKIAGEKQSN